MEMSSIFRKVVLILSVLAFQLVHYEDKQYKPFGFRYWVSFLACIWINGVTLLSYFLVFVAGSIMVSNDFKQMLLWIFMFVLVIAIVLTILSIKSIRIILRRTKYYRMVREES